MYYVIDLLGEPKDLDKAIDNYLIPGFKHGRFLYIKKDSLKFYRSYVELFDECEVIDFQKLKELVLVKHLGD